MSFGYPDGVSIEAFMADVYRQTKGPSLPRGLRVHFDPEGLQRADRNLAATVKINAQGAPLGRSLDHVLGQIGLYYQVKDGLVVITDEGSRNP
jgi:hypothetical protein